MKIRINGNEVEVTGQRVLIKELRERGLQIPSLCYPSPTGEGRTIAHQASCMVCMVKDLVSGQMIPSCAVYPREGMEIDTEGEEVMELRRMAIELLLSNHGARCGACEGKEKCKLREVSLQMKAKWTRFGPLAPVGQDGPVHVKGRLYFETAKCIRCGLCVYNSKNGFTFMYRGYGMQVVIPEENKRNIDEKMADLCPTGALFVRELRPDE